MALEKVVENIREEGRRAANTRLEEARREAAAIMAEAEKQAAAIRSRRETETSAAAEALKRRELAAAELEAKKVRLNAEKEVLGKVRQAVLERFGKLPADQRVRHIQALAKGSTIAGGKLLVAEQDVEPAKRAGLAVAGTVKSLGGVVVVSADGATREDLTYETILDEVWGPSLHDVATALFGKGK